MVDALGGLLTVFGGAAKGGFDAVGDQAKKTLAEDALMRKTENIARVRDKYAKLSEGRQHGHRMDEIGQRDELARNRDDINFERESKRLDDNFQRGILQRETEADIAIKRSQQQFEQQLKKSLEAEKIKANIRDGAKIPAQQLRDWLIGVGVPEEEATKTVIDSVTKAAKSKPHEIAKTRGEIYAKVLKSMAGDMPATKEMMDAANAKTDQFIKEAAGGSTEETHDNKDGGGGKDGGNSGLRSLLNAIGFGKKKPDPKKGTGILNPETSEGYGEPESITIKDHQIIGDVGGLQVARSDKYGYVVKKESEWVQPTEEELRLIQEAAQSGKLGSGSKSIPLKGRNAPEGGYLNPDLYKGVTGRGGAVNRTRG